MTDRSRVAITLATALALGASTYGHAFDISPPGVLDDIWSASRWMLYGFAVVGVFLAIGGGLSSRRLRLSPSSSTSTT
jgi:hypothetical protein